MASDYKSIFSSTTFYGSVTSLLAMFAPKIFVALGMDPQTVAAQIAAAIGFVVTVYGRWTATQPVSLSGK